MNEEIKYEGPGAAVSFLGGAQAGALIGGSIAALASAGVFLATKGRVGLSLGKPLVSTVAGVGMFAGAVGGIRSHERGKAQFQALVQRQKDGPPSGYVDRISNETRGGKTLG